MKEEPAGMLEGGGVKREARYGTWSMEDRLVSLKEPSPSLVIFASI